MDNFIGNHLIHIVEGATEDEDVEAPAPEEVRGALLTMAATKTGRALMQHFVSSGTELKLVNTTNTRTVENGLISAGFMAFYGDDISGQDMAFYNLDIQGFRTTVSEKNPFMLDSVVNTMSLDVLLAAEMGHTRAGNQFGVNEINTYSEVVPHAEIENRYRAERGLPIRRSYKQKDDIKNYMEANN